jgi:phenylalanyl-tRNA synthetase beta chain
MLVSWNWLKEYVPLDMPTEEVQRRLMMAGLNHEGTETYRDDLAIDLEVTSNRPDCLGHIGVAREIAVLFGLPHRIPPARPADGKTAVCKLVSVRIDCPELCSRYTARVVRGLRVGPSPQWLADRLEAIGISPVNNVVDISNYVMMECGQPLHTFDYAKLHGPAIVVREPLPGETIEAIDHKAYRLEPGTCVIADAEVAVAIAGVMGGAGTEVGTATTDVLVESADFNPISIRNTARRLALHSDSSYRFERRVDPQGIDWASRRCCELILELAGGELANGVVDVGEPPQPRPPIVLRLAQLPRVLGIDVDRRRVSEILTALGNAELPDAPPGTKSITVRPPSWRRDLSREIDLVEEVARIHGYEQIPEDVSVPMAPSKRRREDRVADKVRQMLAASGFDEAITLSAVDEGLATAVHLWTEAEPIRSLAPVLRGADRLRISLVPSLLGARQTNEALSNPEIELFEIAKVYLPGPQLPQEPWMLGITSGRGYAFVKGVMETIVARLNPSWGLSRFSSDENETVPLGTTGLEAAELKQPLFDPAASCRLLFNETLLGYVGQLSAEGLKRFDLRGPATAAELMLEPLMAAAELVPRYVALPPYPAVTRDVNLVVDEAVRWAEIAATVGEHAGLDFEKLDYRDTYRDRQRLGAGKKSLLFTIVLRSKSGTLTNQRADEIRDRIVAVCRERHGAVLR